MHGGEEFKCLSLLVKADQLLRGIAKGDVAGGKVIEQDEALNAARKDAFAVIRAASADVPAVSRGTPDLSAVAAWAFVHGLAELLNKGAIQPRDFGLADAEALADQLIR